MSIKLTIVAFALVQWSLISAQVNKPPYFLPGTGDFLTFSIPENFEVGTSVYKLKGKVH